MRSLRSGVVLFLAVYGSVACDGAEPDCGCTVQVGSEHRTLGCGESACVAGTLQVCDKDATIFERGACTTGNGAPTAQAGSGSAEPPTTIVTHYCDDLRTYCNGSCTSPPNPSADCQATASAGDEQACASWPLTNGILCHP